MNTVSETAPDTAPPVVVFREISADNEADLNAIADLHMELLDFGPMAALGQAFVRDVCYRYQLQDGVLRVIVCLVDSKLAGFVAFTPWSISFHRTLLGKRLPQTTAGVLRALITNPARIVGLLRALRVVRSRREEIKSTDQDPLGEVVSLLVRREFLTRDFQRSAGLWISHRLVEIAIENLQSAGISMMRMLVDEDNKAPLFVYQAMGARFESYEQGGEPTTLVRFDLDRYPVDREPLNPERWWYYGRDPRQPGVEAEPSSWSSYWERLDSNKKIFRAEARDVAQRLLAAYPALHEAKILDFGCGFGLVADELAATVREVHIWDAAVNMRRFARMNVAARENVHLFDPRFFEEACPDGGFDLILVNSVCQYWTLAEFQGWVSKLIRLLAPDGKLVVSDLLSPETSSMAEYLSLLRFSATNGFLLRSVTDAVLELPQYLSTRTSLPLKRYEESELRQVAHELDLEVRFDDKNLTYRDGRFVAEFSSKKQPQTSIHEAPRGGDA